MYNENLKFEFINSKVNNSESHRNSLTSIFKKTGKIESKFEKDIYEMDEDEIAEVVRAFTSIRVVSRESRVSIIRDYILWCKEQGLNVSESALMFDARKISSDARAYKNISVTGPEDLQAFLDAVFDKEDRETVDNTYRCMYWVAFAGCKEEEIDSINKSCVDLNDKSFTVNGNKYPIYKEGFKSFKNCYELDTFIYNHPNYTKDFRFPRCDGEYLFRGVKSTQSLEIMRRIVNTKNRKAIKEGRTTKKISYSRIFLCGIFYRMHQLELIGYRPDFSKIVDYIVGDKEYKLDGSTVTQAVKRRRLARDYENDYNLWKETLGDN